MSSKKSEKRRSSIKKKQKKKDCFLQTWGQFKSLTSNEFEVLNVDLKDQAIYNVFAGENHTFFFTMKNELLGFGDNTFNQLYHEKHSNKNTVRGYEIVLSPSKLCLNSKIEVSKIVCGSGFSFCIDNSQRVYSWGLNNKGQLGHGHHNNLLEPTLVRSLSPLNKNGSNNNSQGELDTNESYNKDKDAFGSLMKKFSLYKNEVVVDINCGGSHSIVVTSMKRVLSCGYGLTGALGHEDVNDIESSFREIENLSKFIRKNYMNDLEDLELQIKCGTSHTCCLIYNRLFVWGIFGSIELDQFSVLPIEMNIRFEIADFECGDLLTVFLSTTGDVYTIGDWRTGCLGISQDKIEKYFKSLISEKQGKLMQSSKSQSVFNRKRSFSRQKNKKVRSTLKKELFTPIDVGLPYKVNQIAIGSRHVFALNQSAGKIFGWGNNDWKQLIPDSKEKIIWKPKTLSFLNDCGSFVILCRGNNTFLISRKKIQGTENKFGESVEDTLNKLKEEFITENEQITNFKKEMLNLENEKKQLKELLKTKNIELERMRMTRKEEDFVGESGISYEPNESDYKWEINKIIKSFKKELSEDRTLKPHCEIDFSELEIESQISEGGFGLIFKAKWRESTVAVKVMKQELMKKELIKDFLSKNNKMNVTSWKV